MKTAQNEVTPEEDLLMDLELELAKRIKKNPPARDWGSITGQGDRAEKQDRELPCNLPQIYVQGHNREAGRKRQVGPPLRSTVLYCLVLT